MHKLWGKVRQHNQRGRELGFPTANVNLTQDIPEGIYISQTKIKHKKYPSLTFIGPAKTFNEKEVHAETYLLDFSQNIYNQWISIELFTKIRNNQKFASAKDLINQMRQDEQKARKYFASEQSLL